MTYKVGNYTYESKQKYIDTLGIVFVIFFVSGYFISFFKHLLNEFVYFGSIFLCMLMMLHLTIKYAYVRGKIKNYVFNDY